MAGGGGGGSRPGRGRALSPRCSEEEGALAGVLVQVVVRLLVLAVLGGQRGTPGDLRQLVFELLQLLGQLLHGVGVVGRHRVGESLETSKPGEA